MRSRKARRDHGSHDHQLRQTQHHPRDWAESTAGNHIANNDLGVFVLQGDNSSECVTPAPTWESPPPRRHRKKERSVSSLASSVKTDGRASTARCLASPRGRAASVEQRPSQRTISSRTKDAELSDSPPGISCADRSARSAHRAASATSSLTPLVLPTYHRLPPLAHRRRRAQNKKGNPLKQLHSGTHASVLRPENR